MLQVVIQKIKQKSPSGLLRTRLGVLAGILGLISNLLLFIAKFAIGYLSGSVSITADAINNLSDTISSFLTLVGFKISGKPADQEHPFGHERFEYISGFLVSILITYVGLEFFKSSVEKILHPETIQLSPIVFIVLILSILAKFWQATMYQRISREIQSNTLLATAQDSKNDVITTITVLLSAGVEWMTGWRIDGIAGLFIAIYIIYSGFLMIKDFVDELMGSRPTDDNIAQMKEHLASHPTILGYHDLLVHQYGPNNVFASVHIEVDEAWSLPQAHETIDAIERDFRQNLDVELVCHLDPVPIHNQTYNRIAHLLKEIILNIDQRLVFHDFRIEGPSENTLHFELAVPKECTQKDDVLRKQISQAVQKKIGSYEIQITFDHNYLL